VRVLLDTNVLVAAVVARGLCAELLARVIQGHRWLVTVAIRRELERVLQEKFPDHQAAAASFLEVLDLETEVLPQPAPPADAPEVDPDDLPHLAAAAAGGAEVFVTGDGELLELEAFEGMPIRSPRAAWPLLATS
jgi:putative PIN family toxin of toxin-antitoxin system